MNGIRASWRISPSRPGAMCGDWIDVVRLADGQLAVSMGDAAGHGDQAAALALVLRRLLRDQLLGGADPGRALGGALAEVAELGSLRRCRDLVEPDAAARPRGVVVPVHRRPHRGAELGGRRVRTRLAGGRRLAADREQHAGPGPPPLRGVRRPRAPDDRSALVLACVPEADGHDGDRALGDSGRLGDTIRRDAAVEQCGVG
ncbi:hypothetical protein Franean1_6935 [Parafrankia sp. EAN1pec]|nr:hypothetical protein Franean1_6935 [Frankia sp. EAN1pec]